MSRRRGKKRYLVTSRMRNTRWTIHKDHPLQTEETYPIVLWDRSTKEWSYEFLEATRYKSRRDAESAALLLAARNPETLHQLSILTEGEVATIFMAQNGAPSTDPKGPLLTPIKQPLYDAASIGVRHWK